MGFVILRRVSSEWRREECERMHFAVVVLILLQGVLVVADYRA